MVSEQFLSFRAVFRAVSELQSSFRAVLEQFLELQSSNINHPAATTANSKKKKIIAFDLN